MVEKCFKTDVFRELFDKKLQKLIPNEEKLIIEELTKFAEGYIKEILRGDTTIAKFDEDLSDFFDDEPGTKESIIKFCKQHIEECQQKMKQREKQEKKDKQEKLEKQQKKEKLEKTQKIPEKSKEPNETIAITKPIEFEPEPKSEFIQQIKFILEEQALPLSVAKRVRSILDKIQKKDGENQRKKVRILNEPMVEAIEKYISPKEKSLLKEKIVTPIQTRKQSTESDTSMKIRKQSTESGEHQQEEKEFHNSKEKDKMENNNESIDQTKKIKQSNKIKCKFLIKGECKKEDCKFNHEKCEFFPNCKFGQSCQNIHPKCKFEKNCTRSDCLYEHISKNQNSEQNKQLQMMQQMMTIGMSLVPQLQMFQQSQFRGGFGKRAPLKNYKYVKGLTQTSDSKKPEQNSEKK